MVFKNEASKVPSLRCPRSQASPEVPGQASESSPTEHSSNLLLPFFGSSFASSKPHLNYAQLKHENSVLTAELSSLTFSFTSVKVNAILQHLDLIQHSALVQLRMLFIKSIP